MISYELAKQLKEAGFKQTFHNPEHYIEKESDAKFGDVVALNPEKFISIPTLSELIEACMLKSKDNAFILSVLNGWKCTAGFNNGGKQPVASYKLGNSPEEAVANLWLELKKK